MMQDGLLAAGCEIAFALGTMMQVRSQLEPAARMCIDQQRELGVPMHFDAKLLRQAEIVNAAYFATLGALVIGIPLALIGTIGGFACAALGGGVGLAVGIMWARKTVAWFLMRTATAQNADIRPLTDDQRRRAAEHHAR